MRKRVLVTGGAGFISSNVIRHLLTATPHEVVSLDALTYAGNLENLADVISHERLSFVHGDIRDAELVREIAAGVDVIVNAAAESHVEKSIEEGASEFVTTNVEGTQILLDAIRETPVERFILISSSEVYGTARYAPMDEDHPLEPRSPYAATKAGADRLAYSYFTTYGLPVVISRCTNNYGPYQHPEKLIPLFVTNALEDKPLPVYGTGKNTRDWIHVDDHCAALDLLLEAKGVEGEVFNIGASEEYSVNEIGTAILNTLGKPKTLLKSVADRPGHVRRHAVETKKIRSKLGWKPSRSFTQGLTETMQWYREHEAWWKPIKAGSYRDYHSAQHHGAD